MKQKTQTIVVSNGIKAIEYHPFREVKVCFGPLACLIPRTLSVFVELILIRNRYDASHLDAPALNAQPTNVHAAAKWKRRSRCWLFSLPWVQQPLILSVLSPDVWLHIMTPDNIKANIKKSSKMSALPPVMRQETTNHCGSD